MRTEARAEENLVEAFDFRLKIARDRVKDIIDHDYSLEALIGH